MFRADELDWAKPAGGNRDRGIVRLSDSMQNMRANIWRMPPGARGRRHRELVQEEAFVALDGTPTLVLGEEREAVELPRGSVAVVHPGTAVQVANESGAPATILIVGTPPVQDEVEYLPD